MRGSRTGDIWSEWDVALRPPGMSDGGCRKGYSRAWIGAKRSGGIGWAREGRSEFTSGVEAYS